MIESCRTARNLASSEPAVLAKMQARLAELNIDNFAPDRGSGDRAACAQARKYGGFYGPWVDLEDGRETGDTY